MHTCRGNVVEALSSTMIKNKILNTHTYTRWTTHEYRGMNTENNLERARKIDNWYCESCVVVPVEIDLFFRFLFTVERH